MHNEVIDNGQQMTNDNHRITIVIYDRYIYRDGHPCFTYIIYYKGCMRLAENQGK
jgi:hypothetical protein